MNWNYATYEYLLSAALLVCAMVGMGATLTVRDFLNVVRSPAAILLTLAVQVLLTPLLAVGLSRLFALPPGIAIGLLVVAALPGGLFSNLLAYLGQGNVALSVAATAVCSLGCLATTTLVLKVFASATLPPDFSMPAGRILFEITACLLGPLMLGMLIRRWSPEHHLRVGQYCIHASLALLAVFVISAIGAGRIQLLQYGLRAPAALVLFGVGSLWLAYGLGCLLRLPLSDSFTVGVEVVVRNAHLGVLLKAVLFPARQLAETKAAAGGNAGLATTGSLTEPHGLLDSGDLGATLDQAVQASELGDGVLYVVLFYGAASLAISAIEVISRRRRVGLLFGWYARRLEQRGRGGRESAS